MKMKHKTTKTTSKMTTITHSTSKQMRNFQNQPRNVLKRFKMKKNKNKKRQETAKTQPQIDHKDRLSDQYETQNCTTKEL